MEEQNFLQTEIFSIKSSSDPTALDSSCFSLLYALVALSPEIIGFNSLASFETNFVGRRVGVGW